jgi:hypothetical protein
VTVSIDSPEGGACVDARDINPWSPRPNRAGRAAIRTEDLESHHSGLFVGLVAGF